jgi:hypothetical protein
VFQALENPKLKVLDGPEIFHTAPEPAFDDVTRLADVFAGIGTRAIDPVMFRYVLVRMADRRPGRRT